MNNAKPLQWLLGPIQNKTKMEWYQNVLWLWCGYFGTLNGMGVVHFLIANFINIFRLDFAIHSLKNSSNIDNMTCIIFSLLSEIHRTDSLRCCSCAANAVWDVLSAFFNI